MSRYSLLGNETKELDGGRSLISITTLVAILFGCLGFGYALTAYFAQPQQNMRIDNLDYKIIQVATNLTNETTARIDKDMILMYNISVLSMNIDYLYAVLNMTNNSGVIIIDNLIYLNQSVINITNDITNIYGLLNQTNSSISSIVADVTILNNSVALLLNNVSALDAKTLIAGTGITIFDQNSNSYGTIYLSNISGVAGVHPYPISVTVDEQGRITNIIDGVAPMTSVTVGPGLSVIQMNPSVSGGTLNSTSTYLQLQEMPMLGMGAVSNAMLMYDQYGRIVSAVSGTPPVLSVSPGIGMNFTTINAMHQMGTIDLSNVGTPGTYVHPSSVTTDAQGRVTNIVNGTTPISSISAGTGISFATIDSTNPSGTISLSNIPNVSGAWSNPELTVDGQGRITSIMNGTMTGSGTVTSITAGTGLLGGTITTSGTISMPNVGTPNTYAYPSSITTDAQGRVTNIINGTTPISSISAGTGMSFATINSANPSGSISLSNITGVSGSYTNPSLTVDGQGRITTIMNGAMGGSGTVTSITAGTGLTATPTNPITTSGTINLSNSGPGANTYYPSSITLDAQGRVSSFGNTPYFTKVIYLSPQTYPGGSIDYEIVTAVGGIIDNPIGYANIDPGWYMLCYTLTRTQTASNPAGLAFLRSYSQFEPPIPLNNNIYTYCSNADGAGGFCTHHGCSLIEITFPAALIPILMYRSPTTVVLNPDGRSSLSIVKL